MTVRRFWIVVTGMVLAVGGTLSAMGFPERETLEYTGLHRLEIVSGIFDVEVTAGSGDSTIIEVEDIPRGFSVESREHRAMLDLHITGRQALFGSIPGSPRIRVTTPATVSVFVDSDTGSVTVGERRGETTVESGTGVVAVDDSVGTIRIEARTGDVHVRNSSGVMTCESSTGSVRVEDFQGIVGLESDTGNIEVERLQITGNATFSSDTGSISVEFRNAPADLIFDVATETGIIDFRNGAYRRGGSASGARFLVHGRTNTGNQEYR